MAALTPNHYVLVWSNGMSDKVALYTLRNVTTGDTTDLDSEFSVVKQAIMLGTTVNGSSTASVAVRSRRCLGRSGRGRRLPARLGCFGVSGTLSGCRPLPLVVPPPPPR